MARSAKIYFDVTQLAHWSGKITGIPRVMHELSVRFLRDQPNTVFVTWVKEVEDFCEIDLASTLEQRGKGITYLQQGESSVSQQGEVAPKQQNSSLKHSAVRVAKAGLKHGAKISPRLANKVENHLKLLRIKQYKKAEIQKGDILFIPWGEWWEQVFTGRLVAYQKSGVGLAQIIHDVAPMVWPQFFEQVEVKPETYNRQIVPIADLVLCVSENTKRELIAWLKQNKLTIPKIEVFRNGDVLSVARSTRPTDEVFRQSGLKGGDFLLCVGTVEAKKNHMLFYYVYKLAKARGIDLPKLVIVGRKGWMTDMTIALMSLDPEVKDKFVLLHGKGDEELSWLYDHCMFTVLASFHEGWGIPIAESLSRGVPCIASNTSSMVEIAEGIVEHFSPASSDECLAAIQKWLDPKELQKAKERTANYQPFSWDESAKQIMTYIKEIS